jgi:hypothetical protein
MTCGPAVSAAPALESAIWPHSRRGPLTTVIWAGIDRTWTPVESHNTLKSILTCLTSLTVGSSKRILARGPVSGPHPLGPTRTSVPVPLASAEAHERRRSGSRRRGCGDDGNEANEENSSQAKRALRTSPMPSFPAWVTEP